MTTNYCDTFILVSPDSRSPSGQEPRPGTVAALQHELLRDHPYRFSSDDLLYEVYARRAATDGSAEIEERQAFLARPMACLRASPLVKRYGWGLHHDHQGRVAAFGVETAAYRAFASGSGAKLITGMRSRRA